MRGIALYLGLVLAALALFLLVPQLDIATSALFYSRETGFALGDWGPVWLVSAGVPWIVRGILALVAVAALWLLATGRPLWRFDRRALVFLVAALAVGPGVLANGVMKDHWGRARPSQIAVFGGAKEFTPAPLPAVQCPRNCSFVSGHAAFAFSLVGFAFLLPAGRRRTRWQVAAVALGALVGLGRIAAGAHFLSDVVYAALLMYGTTWLLYRWIVERDVLAAPSATRFYRGAAGVVQEAWSSAIRLYRMPLGSLGIWTLGIVVVEVLLIGLFDQPVALLLHAGDAAIRPFFDTIGRLGLTFPYFVLFGCAYVVLRWAPLLPRLRHFSEPMRWAAAVPAFIFVSLAASGLVVDLLKVICGRARPKLLFSSGTYDFGGLGLQADYWSFPSGHAATVAALMTALWCLWPRHLLFYILCGAVIALSRVVTGAHYPSDVIMGAFIGIVTTRALAGMFAEGRFGLPALHSRRRTTILPEL